MIKTLHEVALENLIAQGMKEGSSVRVMFAVPERVGGWNNCWTPRMDDFVGKTYKVGEDMNEKGVHCPRVTTRFPAFCLELVQDTRTVKLNGSHEAVVTQDSSFIQVGCQNFNVSALRELVQACKDLGVW